MKKIKRWRYYCDHCKKSGGSAYHMKKHMGVCTKNPDRKCGFCNAVCISSDPKELLSIVQKGVVEIDNLDWQNQIDSEELDKISEKVVKDLLEKSEGCPACTLAAIRQTKDSEMITFDYKKAKDQFWKDNPRDEPEYGHDYGQGY